MLFKIDLEFVEKHKGHVYIEANSKDEALEIAEETKDDLVARAIDNASETYESLVSVDVRRRSIVEEDDESIAPDNIEL